MTSVLTKAGALALAAVLAACAASPAPNGFSGSSTPPAAQPNSNYGYGAGEPGAPHHFVTNHQTPMREGPNHGFDTRTVLPAGTPVTPDGYVSGDWWQVDSKFGYGWVYSRSLSAS